jgi:hypothetical protein
MQQEPNRTMGTITLEEHMSIPEFLDAKVKVWEGDAVVYMCLGQRDKLHDIGKERAADMNAATIDMPVLQCDTRWQIHLRVIRPGRHWSRPARLL